MDEDLESWFNVNRLPWAHGLNMHTPGDSTFWGGFSEVGIGGGGRKLGCIFEHYTGFLFLSLHPGLL